MKQLIQNKAFLDELQKQLGESNSSDVSAKISSPKVEDVNDSLFAGIKNKFSKLINGP